MSKRTMTVSTYTCDNCGREDVVDGVGLPPQWTKRTRVAGYVRTYDGHRTDKQEIFEDAYYCERRDCQGAGKKFEASSTPDLRLD